jgi:protocatechuate 3,4-dioxygenase beta subunit
MKMRLLVPALIVGALATTALTQPLIARANDSRKSLHSGVEVGGTLSAFMPTHVTGQDKGTRTCPVCHYPQNPAVQVWVNTDTASNLDPLVTDLEMATAGHSDKKFKAFVVFMNPKTLPDATMEKQLKAMAAHDKVSNVALTYLPNTKDSAVEEYAINTDPQVKNTVFVYRQRKVVAKFINFVADKQGLAELNSAIQKVL